ncbi:MAG: VOC family protein [Nocardioidaceae bacterium]|nr:VOC family protein [Nocardioidaceae bacterium]NUS53133.1 VOC family protein [Nocardioidaceae bacterium]
MPVTWVTAFLDSPPETADAAEAFWLDVTGTRLSAGRGERSEFASLLPDDGDPYVKVQRVVQSAPGGLHLDLHTDDVRALAERAEGLGATTSYHVLGYVVCGSPNGMSFCLVGHPGRRRPPPQRWADGNRSVVDQVCLDIPPDVYDAECAFWAALTGWDRVDGGASEFDRLVRPADVPLAFLLQRLDAPGPAQQTVTGHLDLAADDREAETDRHVALGARALRRTPGWTVLADPAGRIYCITGRRPGDV